jgi:uncharacterized protein with von Willebrand factor type A (vWA) domain
VTDVLATLVDFAAALRAAGVAVGTGQAVAFARAVAVLDPNDRADVYWAGRCTLVTNHADLPTYDRLFDDYFGAGAGTRLVVSGVPVPRRGASADQVTGPAQEREQRDDTESGGRLASGVEALRHKDFAACTPDEVAEIRLALAQMRLAGPMRLSRRTDPSSRGTRPDLRRTLRALASDETSPGPPTWRRRRVRPRPRVLLLDVSGSMASYSRLLLQFGWSSQRWKGPVEVFCFGTRLTRVTRALTNRNADAALAEAAEAVTDWDGGTRIGESIRTYLREHGHRAGCRGAVVIICSDGLECGDPDLLGAQLARLQRLARHVVWVNPLAGGAEFAPTTRGMAAALPHVDVLVAGNTFASLDALSRVVSQLA